MSGLNSLIVSVLQRLPRSVVRPFALRYIAGERLEDAIKAVKYLHSMQIMGTIDVLGEDVKTSEQAREAAAAYEEVLHAIHDNRLNANLSIKLTQFGLKIDEGFCYSSVRDLVRMATQYQNFVRIDMEDSSTTSATLTLYERLRAEGLDRVGVVIQASLRRSAADVEQLIRRIGNVRLCKGAYVEPESIAFRGREEIRQNFMKLLRRLFETGCYVGIATHDEVLVQGAYRSIEEMKVERGAYEFQMLHGVRPRLRGEILRAGHRMRVYVPFGKEWYGYSMRRFKENPQVARYVLRALFSKD